MRKKKLLPKEITEIKISAKRITGILQASQIINMEQVILGIKHFKRGNFFVISCAEYLNDSSIEMKSGEELEKILDTSIEELNISKRLLKILLDIDHKKIGKLKTLKDLCSLGESGLCKASGIGIGSIAELYRALKILGVKLPKLGQ